MDKVRKLKESGVDLADAIDEALREMPSGFEIRDTLMEHKAEVKGMWLTEYNEEEAKQAFYEEGEKKGQKNVADLMKFLLSSGRSEDALRAASDENILNKLLAEFQNGLMAAN